MGYSVIRGYRHTQSTPSTIWTINHNLGLSYPIVDVFYNNNGTMTKILPSSVEVLNVNTVQLTFTSAIAGEAEVM